MSSDRWRPKLRLPCPHRGSLTRSSEHEADPEALVAAVERYGVHHSVLDDPGSVDVAGLHRQAWPTLVVVDPEGYVVASMSGEGHAHGLAVLIEEY